MKCVSGVDVTVPGSTSNLGPGYGAIGLALQLYNRFTFERVPRGLEVSIKGEGAERLEKGGESLVYRAYAAVFKAMGLVPYPVRICQRNEIPLERGLGGSATAAVAGVVGALVLLGRDPEPEAVLAYTSIVEAGSENLTSSTVGGLTVSCRESGRIDYIRLEPPPGLTSVVFLPDFPLNTGQSKQVVPCQVSMADARANLFGASAVIAALVSGEFEKLALAMQDRLHQPYRASLVPGMYDLFQAARRAGSPGAALSGAGSGVFAFALENNTDPGLIGKAMVDEAAARGIRGTYLVLPFDRDGIRISNTRGTRDETAA